MNKSNPVKKDKNISISESRTGEANGLLSEALLLKNQENGLLDTENIDAVYQETLDLQIISKNEQVERIEDKLESIINNQQSQLQKNQSNRPSFLSMPSAKREWQSSQSKQQARLQVLRARLDTVKDIRDGMGVNSPRVEELALAKMKEENPELVKFWKNEKTQERLKKALQQKEKQGKRIALDPNSRSRGVGIKIDTF